MRELYLAEVRLIFPVDKHDSCEVPPAPFRSLLNLDRCVELFIKMLSIAVTCTVEAIILLIRTDNVIFTLVQTV